MPKTGSSKSKYACEWGSHIVEFNYYRDEKLIAIFFSIQKLERSWYWRFKLGMKEIYDLKLAKCRFYSANKHFKFWKICLKLIWNKIQFRRNLVEYSKIFFLKFKRVSQNVCLKKILREFQNIKILTSLVQNLLRIKILARF